jgi:hypothetical protein
MPKRLLFLGRTLRAGFLTRWRRSSPVDRYLVFLVGLVIVAAAPHPRIAD